MQLVCDTGPGRLANQRRTSGEDHHELSETPERGFFIAFKLK